MKSVKKVVALMLALILTVAMGSLVFAAGSKEITATVTAEGEELKGTTDVDDTVLLTVPEAASKLGVKESQVEILWQQDVPADYAGVELTFTANGADSSIKLAVFHHDGAWSVVAQGTAPSMTHTFESLSPVAFVIVKPESEGGTSPNTGASDLVIPAAVLCVLALLGTALVAKRENA